MERRFASSAGRAVGALVIALVLVALAPLLTVPVPVRAQTGTPVASPAAGPVPCTALFGIADPNSSCVLVIHAVPDLGPVDVYIDGALALAGAEFGILGDFLPLPAGEHQVQVTAAGTDPATGVINATVTVEPGVPYELAAVGLAADAQLLATAVDTTPPVGGTARIRVIHAAPDAPAVDIAETGGDVLVADLAYLGGSEPLALPAGTYDLQVRPTGSDELLVGLPGTQLAPGAVYTFYAIGLVADGTIGVFVVPLALPPGPPPSPAATPVPTLTPAPALTPEPAATPITS